MARMFEPSSSFGGEDDDRCDPLGENKEDLEAFLDSALENDPVLRGILEEGLTQIIKAAIRLLNLQRRRDKGQSQGQQKEKMLASKSVMISGDREAPRVRRSPILVEEEGCSSSKDTDNNSPVGTMISVGNGSSAETEAAIDGFPHEDQQPNPERGNELEIPPVDDAEELPCSEGGLNLVGGIKITPARKQRKGRKGTSKHCCYFCQKTFPVASRLEVHLSTHTQEKPFPCNLCGKEFAQKEHLNLHIRHHVKEKAYKCNLCGKDFVQKGSLGDHILRHLKEKWFKCSHPGCTSSFVTGAQLKKHSRVHSREKPFNCNLCGKGFSDKGNRDVHIRRHLKEKAYKCNLCGKDFVQKGELEDHIRRHLKEKAYKCSHPGCSSSFVSSSDLKQHSSVHSGEKPFACPHADCGKAFSYRSSLWNHSRTHSGDNTPFACPFPGCGKTFSLKSNMTRHRKTHDS